MYRLVACLFALIPIGLAGCGMKEGPTASTIRVSLQKADGTYFDANAIKGNVLKKLAEVDRGMSAEQEAYELNLFINKTGSNFVIASKGDGHSAFRFDLADDFTIAKYVSFMLVPG